jgi:hypothetical protein
VQEDNVDIWVLTYCLRVDTNIILLTLF